MQGQRRPELGLARGGGTLCQGQEGAPLLREVEGGERPCHRSRPPRLVVYWPLQDIRSLRICCVQINLPLISPINLQCPHNCNTSARLSRNVRHPHRAPFCKLYTVQYW